MVDPDTKIPGTSEFPSTVWSRLVQGAPTREAAEFFAERYWKPAYLYIRRRWKRSNEDAKDLTQGFFAEALEKGLLSKAKPERGSFRCFLRASLENYLRNSVRDAKTLKRGGGVKIVALDRFEGMDPVDTREGTPDEIFDKEWLEAVFERCLPALRESYGKEGKPEYYEVFRRYDVAAAPASRPTYEALAKELGLSVTDVRNRLVHARKRWQKLIREELRETTASEPDLAREVRDLLGG